MTGMIEKSLERETLSFPQLPQAVPYLPHLNLCKY